MDVKSYISSGILELYVSGQLSDGEAREVEGMAAQHPEVQKEILEIERALNQFALTSYHQAASEGLLDRIMGALEETGEGEDSGKMPADEQAVEEAKREAIVIHKPKTRAREKAKTRPINWRWIAIAASLTLLLSLAANYFQYDALDQAKERLIALSQQQIANAERIEQASQELAVLRDGRNQIVNLSAVGSGVDNQARVYWQQETDQVHFLLSSLPKPPEGKQYQLWAIVDGNPVNAGVLDYAQAVQKGKTLPAQGIVSAFAVTIEPAGGSQTPTLDQMVLYGET